MTNGEKIKETEIKLHPCYCGGEMEIEKVIQNGGMDGTYWNWKLTCKKCGLTMTYAADDFYGRKYKTFEEVIDDWNRKIDEYKTESEKDAIEIQLAVKNGIPLPKGYGNIYLEKDIRAFLKCEQYDFCTWKNCSECNNKNCITEDNLCKVKAVENEELEAYGKHKKRLLKLPSAQPKTGHWIATHDYFAGAYTNIDYVKCSCCHEDSLEEGNFCPNCGAKMDEEVDG